MNSVKSAAMLGCFAVLSLLGPDASAKKNITGATAKSGTAGCNCHGAATTSFSVAITGPSALNVGQTGTYTVTLGSSTTTGVNIAASDGTLGAVTAQLVLNGGELTFSSARNSSTWSFTYTPTTAGTKTLYATGDRSGFPGVWNFAANYTVTASAATSVESDLPLSFSLDQNYPNPFNPSTTIRYTLAAPANVTLDVVDLAGNRVATLVREARQPGVHEVLFNASGLASGVYLYRLTAGTTTLTKKLLLMK